MSGVANNQGAVSGVVDKKVEGWTLLGGVEAGGGATSVAFDGFFSKDYTIYKIYIYNLYPATTDHPIYVKYRNTSGDLTASNYRHVLEGVFTNSSGFLTQNVRGWTDGQFRINFAGVDNEAAYPLDTELTIIDPATPGKYKQCWHDSVQSGGTSQDILARVVGACTYTNTDSPIYGMSFHSSSNLTGKIRIYGLKNLRHDAV